MFEYVAYTEQGRGRIIIYDLSGSDIPIYTLVRSYYTYWEGHSKSVILFFSESVLLYIRVLSSPGVYRRLCFSFNALLIIICPLYPLSKSLSPYLWRECLNISRVWLPILLVVSQPEKMVFSLSPFAPENLVSRDGSAVLSHASPLILYTQAKYTAYSRDS